MRLSRVCPRLPTRDLPGTITFYRDVLGFVADDPWPAEAPEFVILERDGVNLQFYVPLSTEEGETGGSATLSFDVDDARALHQTLATRAVVEWGPEVYWYGRREFAIRDPNGYLLIFSEVTGDPPTCVE